ncbi:phosphoribosylaminoimidazole-succinocarboxamide synthase [Arcanobacterium pluranimalium]|uniref:phosphoribosylaminoimidazolesuccinocarboxamide synthase n=1 Tax=Arcanobacterium pluranimalium TaxID=108028 RepID=UPI001EF952D0|nr:phosphoribosylaminoimidazolesuccinocarboxamide synthase [Arcanobacterium pluranimalium]MBM7824224.1 phosphoribosylaminoimidazole-succinocarboxamide synthase [Arcanobacterium pluranimalium]
MMSAFSSGIASIPGWSHTSSGKVRDLYVPTSADSYFGMETIMMVSSDRISAFDFVMPSVIPDKGKFLTFLSRWWFQELAGIVPNHLLDCEIPEAVQDRALVAQRLKMFPVECTVRGYLAGVAYEEYQQTGAVAGQKLPTGIADSEELAEPIFVPSIKAARGEHDENITFAQFKEIVGASNAELIRDYSLTVYRQAYRTSYERGLILADTKLEYGVPYDNGEDDVVLGDELLTPDSSRFWYVDKYHPGRPQPSFDKQVVRDWLVSEESVWTPSSRLSPPQLPQDIVNKTREAYLAVVHTLTD